MVSPHGVLEGRAGEGDRERWEHGPVTIQTVVMTHGGGVVGGGHLLLLLLIMMMNVTILLRVGGNVGKIEQRVASVAAAVVIHHGWET